ncbi:hypothetical protein D9M68_691410 [compost metagenome]
MGEFATHRRVDGQHGPVVGGGYALAATARLHDGRGCQHSRPAGLDRADAGDAGLPLPPDRYLPLALRQPGGAATHNLHQSLPLDLGRCGPAVGRAGAVELPAGTDRHPVRLRAGGAGAGAAHAHLLQRLPAGLPHLRQRTHALGALEPGRRHGGVAPTGRGAADRTGPHGSPGGVLGLAVHDRNTHARGSPCQF